MIESSNLGADKSFVWVKHLPKAGRHVKIHSGWRLFLRPSFGQARNEFCSPQEFKVYSLLKEVMSKGVRGSHMRFKV